jgi:hypothetical protein
MSRLGVVAGRPVRLLEPDIYFGSAMPKPETPSIIRERARLRRLANVEEQARWLARQAKIEAESRARLRLIDLGVFCFLVSVGMTGNIVTWASL